MSRALICRRFHQVVDLEASLAVGRFQFVHEKQRPLESNEPENTLRVLVLLQYPPWQRPRRSELDASSKMDEHLTRSTIQYKSR